MSRREKYSYLEVFLQKATPKLKKEKLEEEKASLRNKPVLLRSEKKSKGPPQKSKRKTTVKTRSLAVPTNSVYEDYHKLRQLWREYIEQLLADYMTMKPGETSPSLDLKNAQDVLLKADYHGADVSVSDSPCTSQKNISGTVLQETKNIFLICTKQNRLVKIPKKKSIFVIEVSLGYRITIFGSQFCLKPSHRLMKRFNKNPALKDLLR